MQDLQAAEDCSNPEQCGLQRPQCVQCTRSNRLCQGYDRDILFVPVQASSADKKTVMKSMFLELKRNSSHSPPTDQRLYHCLCPGLRVAEGQKWFMVGPTSAFLMRTKALETASFAISAAALGRVYNDTTLTNESLKLYTQGLRELQNALWNPKLMYDDEILAACLSLSLYEVMECPGDAYSAYVSHCNGCMKLVEARGIDRHTSGLAHQLFVGFCSQAILLGLETKRPNFVSSPLWVQGPWKDCPKRVLDRLIDCLANSSIQTIARFGSGNSGSLLGSKQGTVRNLQTAGSLYWPTLSEVQNAAYNPAFGKVFPVAFQFQDLNTARTLMLYWSLAVMVWSGLCALYELITTIEIDPVHAFCPEYPDCVDPYSCACRRLCPHPLALYDTKRPNSHRSAIALIT
ncbi:hypothetical protein V1517DRAFT_310695 [Lipomyces orientalis]|uniref:Uncharacterized protein n=1 Tax=Lipomyces orientalis TaxID=1233043 RepID=A0ACC3TET8_9ASCO